MYGVGANIPIVCYGNDSISIEWLSVWSLCVQFHDNLTAWAKIVTFYQGFTLCLLMNVVEKQTLTQYPAIIFDQQEMNNPILEFCKVEFQMFDVIVPQMGIFGYPTLVDYQ